MPLVSHKYFRMSNTMVPSNKVSVYSFDYYTKQNNKFFYCFAQAVYKRLKEIRFLFLHLTIKITTRGCKSLKR